MLHYLKRISYSERIKKLLIFHTYVYCTQIQLTQHFYSEKKAESAGKLNGESIEKQNFAVRKLMCKSALYWSGISGTWIDIPKLLLNIYIVQIKKKITKSFTTFWLKKEHLYLIKHFKSFLPPFFQFRKRLFHIN